MKKRNIPKIKCSKCNVEISNTQFKKHFNFCVGEGTSKQIKEKNRGIGRGWWRKGKTLKELLGEKRANEIGKILSKALKGKSIGKSKDPLRELERIQKISNSMKGNKNWEKSINVSGRGKKGKYKGIYFASSWELAFIVYYLDHKIKFERNWEKFGYINDKKENKFYVPDFIVGENEYIEVKGYVTKNVLLKKEYFPHTLHIYDKNKMKEILNYVNQKYGKNFVNDLKD